MYCTFLLLEEDDPSLYLFIYSLCCLSRIFGRDFFGLMLLPPSAKSRQLSHECVWTDTKQWPGEKLSTHMGEECLSQRLPLSISQYTVYSGVVTPTTTYRKVVSGAVVNFPPVDQCKPRPQSWMWCKCRCSVCRQFEYFQPIFICTFVWRITYSQKW